MGIWNIISGWALKVVPPVYVEDKDTYPPEEGHLFKGDPLMCAERGHWHSFKADWIVNGVDFGPSTGHSATCLRCGWHDPCVWT